MYISIPVSSTVTIYTTLLFGPFIPTKLSKDKVCQCQCPQLAMSLVLLPLTGIFQ